MNNSISEYPPWESLIKRNFRDVDIELPGWLEPYWSSFRFDEQLNELKMRKEFLELPVKIHKRLKRSLTKELGAARANRNYSLAAELISYSKRYYSEDFSSIILGNLSAVHPDIFTQVTNVVSRSDTHSFLWYLMDAMDATIEYDLQASRSRLKLLGQQAPLLRGLQPSLAMDESLYCRWLAKALAFELRLPLTNKVFEEKAGAVIEWADDQIRNAKLSIDQLYRLEGYLATEFDCVNLATFQRLLDFALKPAQKSVSFQQSDLIGLDLDIPSITNIAGYFQDFDSTAIVDKAIDALEANGIVALLLLGVGSFRGLFDSMPSTNKILQDVGMLGPGESTEAVVIDYATAA